MTRFSLAQLSDDTLPVDAVEMTDEAIEAAVADPTADTAATATDAAALGAMDETLEGSAGDAAALEEAGDVLADGAEAGESIPPIAAEAIRILASRLAARSGVQRGSVNIARESFASKASGPKTLGIAALSLKSIAGNIWKQIVKAYEKVIAFFSKWWNKFFDGATKLRDRAEALAKAAKSKIKDDSFKNKKTVEIGEWGTHLQTKDGTFNMATVIAAGSTIEKEYTTRVSDTTTIVDTMMGLAGDMLDDPASIEAKLKQFCEALDMKSGKKVTNLGEQPDGMEVLSYDLPFGGKAEFARVFTSGASLDDMKENSGSLKVWVDEQAGFRELKETDINLGEVKAADVIKVMEHVQLLGDTMVKNKGDAGKLDARAKKIKDRAAKLAGKTVDDEDGADDLRAIGNAARACVGLCSSTMAAVRSYFLTTGNALCSFVQALLAAAGGKADAEDKKAAALRK